MGGTGYRGDRGRRSWVRTTRQPITMKCRIEIAERSGERERTSSKPQGVASRVALCPLLCFSYCLHVSACPLAFLLLHSGLPP